MKEGPHFFKGEDMAKVTLKIPAFSLEVICDGANEDEVNDSLADNCLNDIGEAAYERASIIYNEFDKDEEEEEEEEKA